MSPEREELLAFACLVAKQPALPNFYRLRLRLFGKRAFGRGLLRAFLTSRWDRIKEDPDPKRWADEFARVGGRRRLLVSILLVACLEAALITRWMNGVMLLAIGLDGVAEVAKERPGSLYCSLSPTLLFLLVVTVCAVYLYRTRNWLRG
jgi:hypothetical protein